MNKWSLLLFSVLGLLLSTTLELNIVDGRLECYTRSSRPLLSDTGLSKPQRAYDTFTEITQLISPKRDIRYGSRNVELKRSTRPDRRRQQSVGRISSDERFRDLNNVVFDLKDSTLFNARVKNDLREINDLQMRRNLNSFSRENFREDRVGRSHSRNDNFLGNEMKRNSREREINTERGNPDINSRQRLIRDTHLTSELSRNNDGRLRRADRSIQFVSKIGILRNGNIQDYRRLSIRGDSVTRIYEKESLNAVRRNTDMEGTITIYRRSYNKDHSEDILEGISRKNVVIRIKNERFSRLDKSFSRPKRIQSENGGFRNPIPDAKRQMNNGFEKRLYDERYSTRRLPSQNYNINRLRQSRLYNDINIEDKQCSNVLFEASERASDKSKNRRIRENNREIRIVEEYISERITPRNKNNYVEKRAVSSNINIRRSEPIRRSVSERLENTLYSRYSLDHENRNNFDQERIRQIEKRQTEDKLREARDSQRKSVRSIAMDQDINNIRHNYDDNNVSQRFLLRNSNNRKLVNRLEHERLSHTSKRASQIRIIQREYQNKNIRTINLQENRIQDDANINRFVSNTNRNVEKRQNRSYNDKSDRAELRNLLVREVERAFDESRTRQVRDIHDHVRKYRLNVERTVERVLTHIDRNRDNVVESGFVSTISSTGKNRLHGRTRHDVTVLRRRENYEVRYSSAHENERIFDQRKTRDVLERREEDIRNERNAGRSSQSWNSMKNAVLNNNRRSYTDKNNLQVILARTNQREMTNRFERGRSPSVNKRSSYLRMIKREHDNRLHNEYREPMNIQENRLRAERCAMRQLAGQAFDINRIVEDRRTGNGILRNRRDLSRIEAHSRNIRIAEIRGLRNINERSHTRDTRNQVIARYFETEVLFHDSETHHERRTERFIRNIARHEVSINNRNLLEARSEKQRDVNRELEDIRYYRSYSGLEKSAHRENKKDVRQTSDGKNYRERYAPDRARDIRAFNGLQILKKESRITKTRRTDEQEREMRTGFSKLRYLPIEYKTPSDTHIFEIKLQHIFYMLHGIYILGLFTKCTINSDGILKRNRFSNWFPLFSTLKVY